MSGLFPRAKITWPTEPDMDVDGSTIDPFYFPFDDLAHHPDWLSDGTYVYNEKPTGAIPIVGSMLSLPIDLDAGHLGAWAFSLEILFPSADPGTTQDVMFGVGSDFGIPHGGGRVGRFGDTHFVGIASNNHQNNANGLWERDEWNKFTLVHFGGSWSALYVNDVFAVAEQCFFSNQTTVSGDKAGKQGWALRCKVTADEATAIKFRNFKGVLARLPIP